MSLGEFLSTQAPEKTYPICFSYRLKQEVMAWSSGGSDGARVCSKHAGIEKKNRNVQAKLD